MLKTTLILAATIAAAGFVVASRALPVQQMLMVSSDANARFLELGFNKAVAIDLPRDVKEVLVADTKTVNDARLAAHVDDSTRPPTETRAKDTLELLLHIHVAPTASATMEEMAEAILVAGRGIEGDRYFLGTGTYSRLRKPDFREVTLFEMEVLDALLRNDPPLQSGPIKIAPADHRRNLTVLGVPLNHLVGKRFRVGDVVLFGGRLNFPCKYLEKLLGLPVYLPLYNRSGLNCVIEKAGVIRRGDPIAPLDAC